jgi:hypothetical protein
VDYLFFVAQGDGIHHYFSKDYGKHSQAVGRYHAKKKKAREERAKQAEKESNQSAP